MTLPATMVASLASVRVAGRQAGIVEGLEGLALGQVDDVGHGNGGRGHSHGQLDGGPDRHGFAGRRFLSQHGAGLHVVVLDRDDPDDEPVVIGRELSLLEAETLEVGRVDHCFSRGTGAGDLGHDRRGRERHVRRAGVEGTEEEEDDGERHDEGAHEDAAHEQHGRALVGRLAVHTGRWQGRTLRWFDRHLWSGGQRSQGGLGGFRVGRDGRRRPGCGASRGGHAGACISSQPPRPPPRRARWQLRVARRALRRPRRALRRPRQSDDSL